MIDLTAIRSLVGPTDPLDEHAQHAGGAASPQAQALLASILATPRAAPVAPLGSRGAGSDSRSRPVLVAAAVVGLLVVGVAMVGPGASTPAVAATPPVLPFATSSGTPAAPTLKRIAAAAEALAVWPAAGPYRYVRTEGWTLNSAVGGGRVTSVLASQQVETWRLPDGSGRTRTTSGANLVDRVGSTETLDAALTKPATREQSLPSADYVPPPLLDLNRLPYGDATALAMAVEHDTNYQIPAGPHLADAIAHLFAEQPVPSAARAKLWRLFATLPGVTDRGELTDRVGRRGTAITLDDDGTAHGLPERYLFIIDPATGQLLECDDVLTTDPGKLNVRVPAILSLTIYLDAGYTTTPTRRPGQ